ncbi:PREDICTED: zinc finger, partial [Prunus dulcis]
LGGLSTTGHTKEDWLRSCVEMVVMDELPFSVVEGKGFKRFCESLNPHFQVPSRRTLVRHFMVMYEEMKQKLKGELASHRVCLTTDTWTSVQNVNYMVITAHFIDGEWNLHKRILNFCVIANHKGNSIGKLLETCLLHWDLKKILTITADNASSNTKAIDYLKSKMGHWKNGSLVLEGKYMHVRCCAHIVNLIVRDGLKKLEKSILAIRNAVRYVRSSPQRLEEFKTCVLKEQIECKGLVVLDVPTRWNSTYLMLDAALKFEKAFVRMGEDDDAPFASWFGEDEPVGEDEGVVVSHRPKKRVGPPTKEDWSNALTFVNFLKVFYDMTLKMSVSLHPASHTTFHNLIAIEGEIGDLFFGEQLPSETHTSTVLKDMACSMKVKFEKYWGDLDKVNQLLMVALVLDPRYKLGNLEFVLKRRFENPQDATKKKNEVKELLMKLYEEYAIPPPPTQCTSANGNTSSTSSITLTSSNKKGGGKHLWEMEEGWIKESQASNTMILEHEVDRYLTDPIEKMVPNFDILKWWKLNGVKYPSLSLIAKDVLSIPVSTVASESCFSTSGRVINSFRASLTPKIVEALICSQNWLRSDDISVIQYEPTIQEMEFYESIES